VKMAGAAKRPLAKPLLFVRSEPHALVGDGQFDALLISARRYPEAQQQQDALRQRGWLEAVRTGCMPLNRPSGTAEVRSFGLLRG
jgi:hypothetical protein